MLTFKDLWQDHRTGSDRVALVSATTDKLRRIRTLELSADALVRGVLAGAHLGAAHGPGTERADAREYQPGDDVRHIDWGATARTGATQVRSTLAERELSVAIVLDAGKTMHFGTSNVTKFEIGATVAAAVMELASRRRDPCAIACAGAGTITWLPPLLTRPPTRPLIASLLDQEPAGDAPLAEALWHVGRSQSRAKLVVICSDLLGEGWQHPLRALASTRRVVVVEPYDLRERELATTGITGFAAGDDTYWLNTDNADVRARFAAHAAELAHARAAKVRAAGATHVATLCSTNTDTALINVLRLMTGRRR